MQVQVQLVEKSDWREATRAGEYGWDDYGILVLLCPFCSFTTCVPYSANVTKKNPLTMEEKLFCIRCERRFKIKEGKAIIDD